MLRGIANPLVVGLLAASLVGLAAADYPVGDLNGNCTVEWTDLQALAGRWLDADCSAPECEADLDGVAGVNLADLALFADHWLESCRQAVHIKWLGHASFKIWHGQACIYLDPWKLSVPIADAALVLVSHRHGDHYSPTDIAKVSGPETKFIAPADVVAARGGGQAIAPGQTIEAAGVRITGVAAYNPAKQYHPKQNNWVGFLIELGGLRIYFAGDTDLTDEMKALTGVDVALLPVGGTYTMNGPEAAEAAGYIQPQLAIPCHWGDTIGSISDAQALEQTADCDVRILQPGEHISSEGWLEDFPLVAHWRLDETEGDVAHDDAGGNSAAVHGSPVWRPSDGMVDGALELDGSNDYVAAGFLLNPAAGPFSVFAWIKADTAGEVIVSQLGGTGTGRGWLRSEPVDGKLMTELRQPGRFGYALYSDAVVTDGNWRRVGLIWDGAYRHLYVDDVQVAADTKANASLESADGGIHIGADGALGEGGFFAGLIDDVRIYNEAVGP
ncbi:MAG: MBL fold metallo-hydrolase [Phycisphaerales bacterium]|nr:MAG: MBL fold metallo-hydrolase [Phycisphaerales bacterium]